MVSVFFNNLCKVKEINIKKASNQDFFSKPPIKNSIREIHFPHIHVTSHANPVKDTVQGSNGNPVVSYGHTLYLCLAHA